MFDIRIYTKMAASQQQKTDAEMTLSKLQNEVCAGRYVFKHPLVITACGVQDKYVFYTACLKCPKRVSEKGNGSVCPIHGNQRGCVYRFALRLLFVDEIGSECWCACFEENAVKILGFTANGYAALETDDERYAAMNILRGSQVMVTIRKRVTKEYVNYNVAEIDVINV